MSKPRLSLLRPVPVTIGDRTVEPTRCLGYGSEHYFWSCYPSERLCRRCREDQPRLVRAETIARDPGMTDCHQQE